MKKSKATILKITGLSNEVFEIFRFELNAFLLRLSSTFNPIKRRTIKRYVALKNIKLNVGAGPFGEDGWVNIDMFLYKNVSFTYDCRKKLPFLDSTVSKIRCEHLLEHMDREYEAPKFLGECNRVMKENAVLRIVVPDIEKYIHAYYLNNWSLVGMDQNPTYERQAADILTHTFRQGGEHKFGYDFNGMEKILLEAGFSKIMKMEYGKSNDLELKGDLPNHRQYSLYVEAFKQLKSANY